MSTATTSSDRKDAMKLIRISPKTVTASQTSELAELLHKAFLDFNKSLTTTAHIHAVREEFGDPALSATVTASIVKGCEGFAVLDGKDGKMVGVTFVDVNAEGPNKVASIGPVGSISAGCGRKTFEAACQHAEDLGFKTLLLQQVAANTRSFSLYAKVGFEAKHTCHYFGGFISSDSSDDGVSSGASCTVSTMAEKDVDECGALHAQAHGDTSWDRRPSIAGALAEESPFPMLVARGADGEVVGYSTGFYLLGHQVAKSEEVFKALVREGSRLHKEKSLPIPSFHNCLEYPRLVSWALSEKLTLLRVTVLMAKGPYDHAWPQNGFVFAPGIGGW